MASTSLGTASNSSWQSEYPDPESLSTSPWWRDALSSRYYSNDNDLGAEKAGASSRNIYEEGLDHHAVELSDEDISSDESFSELSQRSWEDRQHTWDKLSVRGRGRPRGGKERTGLSQSHGEAARRSLKGIKRGQRKPLEPSDEFKDLQTQAASAFVDVDLEAAEQLTLQAILVNPEIYAAHSLLAEIHSARGDDEKALTALFNGAHTRPRDPKVWTDLAKKFLRHAQDDSALTDALYCYSRAIQVEPQNVHARHQRAELNRRLGYNGRAAAEYEFLLKTCPHNLAILRSLAEIYTELDDSYRAMEHYNTTISFYRSQEPEKAETFTWSDVNIYVELFADQQRYDEGVCALKSLSRWLLGRPDDPAWEALEREDSEYNHDHHPQRVQVQRSHAGVHGDMSYGKNVPIELHVKWGMYRIRSVVPRVEEATRHFELLEPDNSSEGALLYDYPDLFRDVANALRDTGCYHEALRYYQPLQQLSGFVDSSDHAGMAFCYKSIGLESEAEACYRTIVEKERNHSGTQIPLRRFTSLAGVAGESMVDATNGMIQQSQGNEVATLEAYTPGGTSRNLAPSAMLMPRSSKQSSKHREYERRFRAQLHEERMRSLYARTQKLLDRARGGDVEALAPWMAATQELVDDFRAHRAFYPCDRSLKAYERSKSSAMEAQVNKTMQNIIGQLEMPSDDLSTDPALPVRNFRCIPIPSWLDLMLEYAVLLARSQAMDKAYEVVNVARSANVFYSSIDSMFLIHVCALSCALIGNDEETSCSVARWFMKEFQFVTDGYRLFSAVNRLCDGRNTWFNCGPSQKYIRRQLKAMDYSLVGHSRVRSLNQERASYTTKNSEGKPIHATDMDLALLMLYGHMLYLGKSFAVALNYFFRALALDPKNPMVNLSLALSYVQYAMKRQADNRHYLITQGLAFLFTYYDLRRMSSNTSEQQEAEYNVARTYHMLGLTHLAIPYYEKCLLRNGTQGVQLSPWDDFSAEAAFALRNIWAANGEAGKASDIGRSHLVI